MIAMVTDYFAMVQAWLFENMVQPFLFRAGLGEFAESAFEGTRVRQSQHRRGSRQVVIGDQIDVQRPRAPALLARAVAAELSLHRLGAFKQRRRCELDPVGWVERRRAAPERKPITACAGDLL